MLLLLLFFSGYQLHVGHSQGLRPFISTVQNADCRPLFSVLESNGTIVFSPSFAWWKQWSAAVSSLHFIRTVLATNLSGSIFCPQWLSPLHCHGGCESILFSCSFQTGTLLLNLISCRLHFNYSAFFPPKRSRRWIFGKGEVNNGSTLIQRFLSVLVSGRLSLPLRTHDQFQHWTPRLNSAVWPVPYACAKPHHQGMEALISCLVPRRLSFDDPSHGPLWFITSHSFRARLCHAKNEAPEEEAALLGLISMA